MHVDPRLGSPDEISLAREMHRKWQEGVPKSTLEQRYLGTDRAHGKRFTSLIKKHLGIDTEHRHPLMVENKRLRAFLRDHSIDPDLQGP